MEDVKVKVLGIVDRWVKAKFGRQRKERLLTAFIDDKGNIIAQGDDCIFQINTETREAVYNLKGGYFPHLNPLLGAKKGKVPQEFIDALKQVVYQEGDVIGFLPKNLGGSKVIFGGCKTL